MLPVPDLKWLPETLRLPARIFAGLFMFFAALLVLDYLAFFPLIAIHPLAWAVAVLGALLFGLLCLALLLGMLTDAIARRHKRTLIVRAA